LSEIVTKSAFFHTLCGKGPSLVILVSRRKRQRN
jgi:shikimate kinase